MSKIHPDRFETLAELREAADQLIVEHARVGHHQLLMIRRVGRAARVASSGPDWPWRERCGDQRGERKYNTGDREDVPDRGVDAAPGQRRDLRSDDLPPLEPRPGRDPAVGIDHRADPGV